LGYLSLLIIIGTILAAVFLLKWIHQIKRNTEFQVEQNKKIIQLLKKEKIE
jgi:hypothetical protein